MLLGAINKWFDGDEEQGTIERQDSSIQRATNDQQVNQFKSKFDSEQESSIKRGNDLDLSTSAKQGTSFENDFLAEPAMRLAIAGLGSAEAAFDGNDNESVVSVESVGSAKTLAASILGGSAFDADNQSILSLETIGSATTLVASAHYKTAFEELLSLLTNDAKLQLLFATASKKSVLDGDHFQNGLRRLLKIFAHDLAAEAVTPIHYEAVHFLSRSARQVSYAITNFYFESEQSILNTQSPEPAKRALLSNWLENKNSKPGPVSKAIETGILEEGEESLAHYQYDEETESEDEPVDNEPASISALTGTIEFLSESRAYEKLCRDLDRFVSRALIDWQAINVQWKSELNCVAPIVLKMAGLHQVQVSEKERSESSDKIKIALEKFSGEPWDWWPLQPPRYDLLPGKVRLIWTCVR
jgi:hypothetical protein